MLRSNSGLPQLNSHWKDKKRLNNKPEALIFKKVSDLGSLIPGEGQFLEREFIMINSFLKSDFFFSVGCIFVLWLTCECLLISYTQNTFLFTLVFLPAALGLLAESSNLPIFPIFQSFCPACVLRMNEYKILIYPEARQLKTTQLENILKHNHTF